MPRLHPNLETGHAQIDAEHCEFIERLGAMRDAIDRGAGREQIVELIVILQKYALLHFSSEEAYMQRVGCPAFEVNCAAHRDFAQKLDAWLELLGTSGSSVSLLSDIQREASSWMLGHIVNVDCTLRSCQHA